MQIDNLNKRNEELEDELEKTRQELEETKEKLKKEQEEVEKKRQTVGIMFFWLDELKIILFFRSSL